MTNGDDEQAAKTVDRKVWKFALSSICGANENHTAIIDGPGHKVLAVTFKSL